MARKMNLNTLEQKIEKAQQEVVKIRDGVVTFKCSR